MKLTHLAAALSAIALATPALAQDAPYTPPEDELVEAQAIMNAMFPPETREDSMLELMASMGSQVADGMMQGPVFEEPGIKAIMDEFVAEMPVVMRPMLVDYLPKMIDATAIAYTREFTLEELRDISAFASTPSGKRYFSEAQSLLNDPVVAEVNKEFFANVSTVQQAETVKLTQKVQQYLLDNSEVLGRLKAAGVGD